MLAHTAGSYRCASRARLRLHGAVSFAVWGSLPTDHMACEVECEGWERPALPHRRTCIHDAYHRMNTTGTARNRAAATRSRRNGVRVLRSDRLLRLPPADRQGFGCSPAVEGLRKRCPPKYARFSGHMSGKRRSSARRRKVGIARRDGSQEKGKAGADDTCGYLPPRRAVSAQRVRRGGSFQLPANTGCRQGRKGRGHGTPQARESRSIIIPPRHYGRAGTESAGWNPWPRPSNYHHRPPLKPKKRGFVHPP